MKRIALKGATVIDGNGGPAIQKSLLLIERGTIASVGTTEEHESEILDAETIDCTGMHIVPGFINVHEHVLTKRLRGSAAERAAVTPAQHVVRGIRNALVSLSEGVTTIRDAGSYNSIGLEVKKALQSGSIIGPDMQAVAQGLTVTGGYAHQFFLEVDTPIEAKKAAGTMIKNGADWIKCMASIEWGRAMGEPLSAVNMDTDIMRAAFDVGHHHGKGCMVHAVCEAAIANSLAAGADSIEHGVMLTESLAERMAQSGVFLVPTLSGWRQQCNDWGRGDGLMRHSAFLRPFHDNAVKVAHAAGVRMAYGSDTLGNLVDEVAALFENGLSLGECLQVVTRNGADLLRIGDRVGTIAPGKRADFVVLGSDPLTHPSAYGDIRMVFRDGREFKPAYFPI